MGVIALTIILIRLSGPRTGTEVPVASDSSEPDVDREHTRGRDSDADLNAADPKSRPSEWNWIQRTFPHYQADPGAIRVALAERQQLARAAKTSRFGAWTFLGPADTGGRVVDIEYNPKDPEIVYLAAATGGVFRSDDGGETWAPIFDEQAVLTVGDIGVDPNHPDTVYVGTGEANGGHNNFAGAGIFKSTDGGASWSYSGLESVVSIGRVVVDPSNSDRVFVAAVGSYFLPNPERGVYRSNNGGLTWDQVLSVSDSTGAIDLVINPRSPDTLFAATWERVRRPNGDIYLHGASSGIHRSTDGGDTWELLGASRGLPDPDQYLDNTGRPRFGRIGLAISESNPNYLVALYTNGNTFLGLYRSHDGGDSWESFPANSTLTSVFADFSWYFGQVRISPKDPKTIFVLDVNKARTDDGGETWTRPTGTHVDYHALAFHPQDSLTMLIGNDGGLEKSTNGGVTVSGIRGLPITQFYEVAFDPNDTDNVLGGTQDNGTVASRGSYVPTWDRITGGDGFYVIVSPDDPYPIYSTSQNGQLYRNGSTIVNANAYKSNWSTPIVMHPENSQILYYGSSGLLRSTTSGGTFAPVSGNLTSHGASERLGTITTISVSSTHPEVIYVGTDDGNVWVTTDDAATWTKINDGLPLRWVTRIESHPEDPAMAVVTFSGLRWRDAQPHVFRTYNYGQSWVNISGNLPDAPINALALDPDDQDQIFVGTDVGAFYTEDGGQRWDVLGTGMPAVPVNDMKFIASDRRLLAGTHGRSMYAIAVPGPPTSIDEPPTETETTEAVAFPNPSSGVVTLRLTNRDDGPLRINIYDVIGRRVRTLDAVVATGGIAEAQWDGTDAGGAAVAPGVYFATLEATDVPGKAAESTLMFVRTN